jgi:hypothetical protein
VVRDVLGVGAFCIGGRSLRDWLTDRCSMNRSSLIVALSIAGVVVFRLLWAGSQLAAGAGLGRAAFLPKGLRRWLFGEPNNTPTR